MTDSASKLSLLLRNAQQIMVFTGAGISTASGIPDFRGPNGVWSRRQPVYYDDFMRSEQARIEHWDYKVEGWPGFVKAQPNATHYAIADLEKAGKLLVVITQNIDGLHARAGTSSERLIELHGTNSLVECQTCHWRGDPEPYIAYFETHRRCPLCSCGGFLKFSTISFGQDLDPVQLERARIAGTKADLVIALGSTLSVTPASLFPLAAAKRGVPYVIINRGGTEHDQEDCVTLRIDGDVNEIFPAAVKAVCA
jgi:NAD-dependent deacetylase